MFLSIRWRKAKTVDVDVLFRRRRKRRKIFGEGEYLFFWRRRKTEKEKEENIWKRSLPKVARILRSVGFGLSLKTFANILCSIFYVKSFQRRRLKYCIDVSENKI